MLKKPTIKREVAVDTVIRICKQVNFYATADAVTEFEQFGRLDKIGDEGDLYRLLVDARYSFEEVLSYIENYG